MLLIPSHLACPRFTLCTLALTLGASAAPIARQRTDPEWSAVVRAAAERIESQYVDPGVGQRCRARLLAALESGSFESVQEARRLAREVTLLLKAESGDGHLALRYRPAPVAGVEDLSRSWMNDFPSGPRANHGFQEARLLPGNIGYLNIRYFAPPELGLATAEAALRFLSNVDAFVIDVRGTPGGIPLMARWLCSFFFDERVHLASMQMRGEAEPRPLWTQVPFPLPRKAQAPVYVLVDERTFSAAESLARWLQYQGRAVIVGARTKGGAHVSPEYRVDERFVVSVPLARVTDPDGGLWEDGILPDVPTGGSQALEHAHVLALEELGAQLRVQQRSERKDVRLRILEWHLDDARARLGVDRSPDRSTLATLAGHYGPRQVEHVNGALFYARDGGERYRLEPLGEDRFRVLGLDWFRVRFERDDAGRGAFLHGLYADGRTDAHARASDPGGPS